MNGQHGDSTRSVTAVNSEALAGQPVSHGPVPASAYHLSPVEGSEPDTYGRSSNPTWRHLESALAQLEGATTAVTFRIGDGGDHRRPAGARRTGIGAGRARRRLLPGASLRRGKACAAGHHGAGSGC